MITLKPKQLEELNKKCQCYCHQAIYPDCYHAIAESCCENRGKRNPATNPITIQLEGGECRYYKCHGKGKYSDFRMNYKKNCIRCLGTGKIYSEQEGDEIDVSYANSNNLIGSIKIKILSINRKTGEAVIVKVG